MKPVFGLRLLSACTLFTLPLACLGQVVATTVNDTTVSHTVPAISVAAADGPISVPVTLPYGSAKGIFPGRVTWVHDVNAVNQACVADNPASPWYLTANNNQTAIDAMVSKAIQNLTGQTSNAAAWTSIFQYHNNTRGKGAVNYAKGEKIFIKINATSAWTGNFNTTDLSANTTPPYAFISETSVGTVLAVLRQLVNVVGVDQKDIYVGDPLKHVYKHLYNVWHGEFPNVHYIDNGGYTNLGRENVTASSTATITYSDKGQILKTNVWSDGYTGDVPTIKDNLYSIFQDAEYMINIPMLKGHKRAGMTMFAKNHFGSQTRADASHLHNGLVAPTEMPNVSRGSYGLYRVQVDIMGHSLLGKKNLLYLMDALWSTDQELGVPLKWQMPPFYNTYMASIFASLDPVAIESVGYDFLRTEFTHQRVPAAGTYIQMPGVNDYLLQAASSANWPSGVQYDPDATGTPIGSLGSYAQWNNSAQKTYPWSAVASLVIPAAPVSYTGIELAQVEVSPPGPVVPNRAAAISTRAFCGTGNNVAIAGFVISGAPKRVLLRAVGSTTLASQGLSSSEVLQDPMLELHDVSHGNVVIGTNNNWGDNDNANDLLAVSNLIYAYPIYSSDTKSAALLLTLQPGVYSVVASGQNGTTGNVLVEVYDADLDSAVGTLAGISTRAYAGTGNNVAIGGFVISGTAKNVLIRGVGPTLTTQGLGSSEVLQDPAIELHDVSHGNVVIATNDNWGTNPNAANITATAARIQANALSTIDTTSAALLKKLDPGVYSVVASGTAGKTGIVLVEVFDAD